VSENEREREEEDDEDVAWLLARERGEPGPAISDATAARYARLESLIADLPRPGWEQDVLAGIDAAEAERDAPIARAPAPLCDPVPPARMPTRPRRWALATAVFAAAAIVVILFAVYRGRGGAPAVLVAGSPLAFEVQPAGHAHRGSDPSVGDTLIVRGEVEGTGELRVYDETGVEQAHCTVPAADCSVERQGTRTTLRLTMVLRAPGTLSAVLFAAPLRGPSSGLDADVEAARRAGIALTPKDIVIR
jgi:hypothetical protein